MIWLDHSLASSVTPRLLAPPAPVTLVSSAVLQWIWAHSWNGAFPCALPSALNALPSIFSWLCPSLHSGLWWSATPSSAYHSPFNVLFFGIFLKFSSVAQSCLTPWTTAYQVSLSITNSWSLPKSCPLSQWCHPTISSSVVPSSSCPQSFPASGSFQMSQLFTLGGQSIGTSASASVPPMNTQDWSPLGWT